MIVILCAISLTAAVEHPLKGVGDAQITRAHVHWGQAGHVFYGGSLQFPGSFERGFSGIALTPRVGEFLTDHFFVTTAASFSYELAAWGASVQGSGRAGLGGNVPLGDIWFFAPNVEVGVAAAFAARPHSQLADSIAITGVVVVNPMFVVDVASHVVITVVPSVTLPFGGFIPGFGISGGFLVYI